MHVLETAVAHNFFMFTLNIIFSSNSALYESVVLLGCLPSVLHHTCNTSYGQKKIRCGYAQNVCGAKWCECVLEPIL